MNNTDLSRVTAKALSSLEVIAEKDDLSLGHWITDSDCADEDYCERCIDAAVVLRRKEGHDAIRDGGWTTEHDSPPYCESCGEKIGYTPTDYCAEQELEHFGAYPPEADIGPNDAYDLTTAIRGSDDVETIERVLRAWAKCCRAKTT